MARKRRWRFVVLFLALGVVGCLVGHPLFHLTRTALRDQADAPPLAPGFVDDASRMNPTEVAEVWSVPAEPAAAEEQLRQLLRRATAEDRHVAIAGARHTMGGHTISPQGIVIDMLPFHHMELNEKTNLLRVGAGARWADVIAYLDRRGRSVSVMQSNNSFSVGGSLSANCHGWQQRRPPIASTVESFRLMRTDGTIVRCSRSENAELFRLVLGGYGLFGIILEADLHIVPNEAYRPEVLILPSDRYVATFQEKVSEADDVGMAFGRLCIVPGEKTFLREALLTVFHRIPTAHGKLPALREPALAELRRLVFRGSVDSDYGKKLRWNAEKQSVQQLKRRVFSRNQLQNESVEVYEEHGAARTDILHEYFIPPARFAAFLERLRVIIPRHEMDLLNVTIRDVRTDPGTELRYADQDLFGLVMLFTQPRTAEADARMEALTRELIDAALNEGGRYYLPYRLHATPEQFERAYPEARHFFAMKRRYDPQELLQNQFYLKYGK